MSLEIGGCISFFKLYEILALLGEISTPNYVEHSSIPLLPSTEESTELDDNLEAFNSNNSIPLQHSNITFVDYLTVLVLRREI